MSLSHLSREDAEGYVMGLLDEASAARLEEHVVACLPCGRLLAAEARREVALAAAVACLGEPAASAGVRTVPTLAGRVAARASSALAPLAIAAAAALLLLAGPGPRPLEPSPGGAAADPAGLASTGSEPLLACWLEGEAALCPLPERISPGRRSRTVNEAMTAQGPALCRSTDGTCQLQSR